VSGVPGVCGGFGVSGLRGVSGGSVPAVGAGSATLPLPVPLAAPPSRAPSSLTVAPQLRHSRVTHCCTSPSSSLARHSLLHLTVVVARASLTVAPRRCHSLLHLAVVTRRVTHRCHSPRHPPVASRRRHSRVTHRLHLIGVTRRVTDRRHPPAALIRSSAAAAARWLAPRGVRRRREPLPRDRRRAPSAPPA
jgi:hypothetical protein